MIFETKQQLIDRLCLLLPAPLLRRFLNTFERHMHVAEKSGYHLFPKRFDSPIPDISQLDIKKLQSRRPLPGVQLHLDNACDLARKLGPDGSAFLIMAAQKQCSKLSDFRLKNESFEDFDAAVLYAMIRHLRPKRYVEIGCGFSSMVSSMAIREARQNGGEIEAFYIDPEPRKPFDESFLPGQLIRRPVENISPDFFQCLGPGDILFIDTSHVLKVQSDVVFELTEILPALPRGVYVHIHDVFTPYDYLESFVFSPLRTSMNEQYAVECLLSGGNRFEVVLPLYCLFREHYSFLASLFPGATSPPHSFWIRSTCN